jgi:hypothetical protein
MDSLDWSVVNTALLLGAIGYLYRQARLADALRQAVLGLDGHGGMLDEIRVLRERSHTLANALTTLNGTVELLTERLDRFNEREPGEERRRGK